MPLTYCTEGAYARAASPRANGDYGELRASAGECVSLRVSGMTDSGTLIWAVPAGGEAVVDPATRGMESPTIPPVPQALERAVGALSEAATELTFAMLAAGRTPLGDEALVLAEAVEAELAAVAAVLCRHRRR